MATEEYVSRRVTEVVMAMVVVVVTRSNERSSAVFPDAFPDSGYFRCVAWEGVLSHGYRKNCVSPQVL